MCRCAKCFPYQIKRLKATNIIACPKNDLCIRVGETDKGLKYPAII